MIIKDILIESKKRIDYLVSKDSISGIPSGFKDLDKITNGWQDSELVVIGGRPGMGKSSFAITMCRNLAVKFNINTLFFSIESTANNVTNKLISLETGINLNKLRAGKLEKHEWALLNVKTVALENSPLLIHDEPSISVEKIEKEIRRRVAYDNVQIVVIDYLQLVTIDDKNVIASNREQCISIIIKKLKGLAKELEIPIILLSQLNRNLEERGGAKRPLLIDLRDSGTIAEDSDLVFFLYRPEYYNIDEWDDEERASTEGEAELVLAKNRNGDLGNIRLKFQPNLGEFDDLEVLESSPFAFKSKLVDNDSEVSPDQAFGRAFGGDDDNDVPF